MTSLKEIIENKKSEILELKKKYGEHIDVKAIKPPSFIVALKKENELSVIAEIKRKSPSHGIMEQKDSVIEIAKEYEEGGANAISVLTDKKFFDGSFEFLSAVSKVISIPALCKDFILDKIQIDLARLSGASAILLIAEILDDRNLHELYEYAISSGIDVLLEVHEEENIKRALEMKAPIIGINNRNLRTMQEDLNYSLKMIKYLPEEAVKLSLSSFRTREDAIKAASAGFDGILVGASLMKSQNRKEALKEFLGIRREGNKTKEI